METAVYCQDCQTVFGVVKDLPSPLDKDMWALAKTLQFTCTECGRRDNFGSFTAETLENLKLRAREMNLKWAPSPQFGKIGDRDYIQAIRNLIQQKGEEKWPNLV